MESMMSTEYKKLQATFSNVLSNEPSEERVI